MIDPEKQVTYWKNGAEEELYTARRLLTKRSTRQCLFFAHLAIEKALKAHICRRTGDLAPRSHNLPNLAHLTGLVISDEQQTMLQAFNEFNLEGRYPEQWPAPPALAQARIHLDQAGEILRWLINLL
jgi:HEPN domain-containing protein